MSHARGLLSALSPSQRLYLTDVLGIKSVILPEGYEAPDAPVFTDATAEPSFTCDFFVLVEETPSPAEAELLKKILAAVSKPDATLVTAKDLGGQFPGPLGVVFGSRALQSLSLSGHEGDFVAQGSVRALLTYPLSMMVEGSPRDISEAKKQTWHHLKKLKELDNA